MVLALRVVLALSSSRVGLEDFPGGLVSKTLCSQCREPGVRSLVRELDPTTKSCYSQKNSGVVPLRCTLQGNESWGSGQTSLPCKEASESSCPRDFHRLEQSPWCVLNGGREATPGPSSPVPVRGLHSLSTFQSTAESPLHKTTLTHFTTSCGLLDGSGYDGFISPSGS